MSYGRPVWAEINKSALKHNIQNIKSYLAPQTKFCAVVKADGYGHGAVAVAQEAIMNGADYLAVAIIDEALILRLAGLTHPILVLGYTPPAQSSLVVGANLTQTIFNLEQAQALSAVASSHGSTARVHLKIDTGMGRLGVSPAEAANFAAKISEMPNLFLEGAFTHFAAADTKDKAYTDQQFNEFSKALEAIKDKGISIPIRHCANSAATLDLPKMHLDMVRCGIIIYGLTPSDETTTPFELRPAMSLKAKIAMIKDVPADTSLSYGRTFVTKGASRIATLPLGYADGWTRMLSDKGTRVMISGQEAPLVGRICMDQCLADVSGLKSVNEGDEVLLFGGDSLPATEVAARLGTINYEIVCMIGKRVPRIYI